VAVTSLFFDATIISAYRGGKIQIVEFIKPVKSPKLNRFANWHQYLIPSPPPFRKNLEHF
jgi:hypothetical protein